MIDEKLKRKLLFRAQHRGIREMDIVLSRYCAARIEVMNTRQVLVLSGILHINDQPMYQALSEENSVFDDLVSDAPEEFQKEMIAMLQDIHVWMRAHPYRGES